MNNRGNKLALGAFNDQRGNNPTTLADAGNGFLMRQGYAVLWSGWNGDVAGGEDRLTVELPVARPLAGSAEGSITGPVYTEICVDAPSQSEPLLGRNSRVYPSVTLENGGLRLTRRARRSEPAVEIPHEQWCFARWEDGKAVPDPAWLHLRDGFRPGWLYELVYTAKNPRVTGLGAAAVRDAIAFFRYGRETTGGEGNPLAGGIDRAYAFGISQSARFLQHFLAEDRNADERGRLVFDAVFCHVGGPATGIFNARFAQPTRHGSPHEDRLYPADVFPFATTQTEDPFTGRRGDWLERSRRSGRLPKIMLTQTSSEYWLRAASLLHTDPQGRRDVPLDPHVLLYCFAGGQHLFSTPAQGICAYPVNTLNYRPALRALLVALDEWVTSGRPPPESAYPRIADGTLVEVCDWREAFPRLAGVVLPEGPYAPMCLDLGPRWDEEGIADFNPPRVRGSYQVLVPAVDADGNDLGGVRLPDVAVPPGTYAGWNARSAAAGAEGMPARWIGSYWPFARTADDARRAGDPRRSIAERYPSRLAYQDEFRRAAAGLQARRFLLDEDVAGLLEEAVRRDVGN